MPAPHLCSGQYGLCKIVTGTYFTSEGISWTSPPASALETISSPIVAVLESVVRLAMQMGEVQGEKLQKDCAAVDQTNTMGKGEDLNRSPGLRPRPALYLLAALGNEWQTRLSGCAPPSCLARSSHFGAKCVLRNDSS